MSTKLITLALALSACGYCQTLSAPANLIPTVATKSEVRFTWTGTDSRATGYIIERKELDGVYGALSTVAAPENSAIDRTVAQYTTYQYRVRATSSAIKDSTSAPSNDIIIGPPPVGLKVVAGFPAGITFESADHFAQRLQMEYDSNGDPAFCYHVRAPNAVYENTFIEFFAWDRVAYAWRPRTKVAVVGNNYSSGAEPHPVMMSHDDSNNVWGIVYEVPLAGDSGQLVLYLATSKDNGLTWTSVQIAADAENQLRNPAIVLAGGKAHISYYHGNTGIRYLTGLQQDSVSKWNVTTLPKNGADDYRLNSRIAVDTNGDAMIAYWTVSGYNSSLWLWRSKTSTVMLVLDSRGIQNDQTELELAVYQNQARILAFVVRDQIAKEGYDHEFWVAKEVNNTFSEPAGLPSDGNTTVGYGALSIGPRGQAAVVTDAVGGNSGGVKCGLPKLSLSEDAASWSTCSPFPYDPDRATPYDYYGAGWPKVKHMGNNKLYLAFVNSDVDSSKLSGVILYREP